MNLERVNHSSLIHWPDIKLQNKNCGMECLTSSFSQCYPITSYQKYHHFLQSDYVVKDILVYSYYKLNSVKLNTIIILFIVFIILNS